MLHCFILDEQSQWEGSCPFSGFGLLYISTISLFQDIFALSARRGRKTSPRYCPDVSLFKYTEKFTTQKWKVSDKSYDSFHISAQNIDCGYLLESLRRGGSNEYPQSMFLSSNKTEMYTPVNPSSTIQKWGLRGSTLYMHVLLMYMCAFWDWECSNSIFENRSPVQAARRLGDVSYVSIPLEQNQSNWFCYFLLCPILYVQIRSVCDRSTYH